MQDSANAMLETHLNVCSSDKIGMSAKEHKIYMFVVST